MTVNKTSLTDGWWKELTSRPNMVPTTIVNADPSIYAAFFGHNDRLLCVARSDSLSSAFYVSDGSMLKGLIKVGSPKWKPVRDGKEISVRTNGHAVYFGIPAGNIITQLRKMLDASGL